MDMPVIMAHRGASAHSPENTLPAFRLAIEQGAGGIELDVHLTSDGIPVVIHDETTGRTGTHRNRIAALTLAELQRDDFGIWRGMKFAGTRIPALEDVLKLTSGWRGFLNIELKTDVTEYPGMEESVLKLVSAAKKKDRVIISSFNHKSLARCRAIDPDIELAALIPFRQNPDLRALQAMGATAIHPDVRAISPFSVRRWHQAGFRVRPYTVDKKPLLFWVAFCGVDAVFTNKPKESAAFLRFWCRKQAGAEDPDA
jgi:glycerophosphoryl diester phosphodiesterase